MNPTNSSVSATTTQRRIKKLVIFTLISAGIVLLSYAIQYGILMPLGIATTESFGLAWFLLTQVPFAIIAAVLGFVSFFYGLKNPTWRAGRIVLLVVVALLLVIFVGPLVLGLLLRS